MKDGESCDLLKRLSLHSEFGMTEEEMAEVLEPRLYIGRCPRQVDKLVSEIKTQSFR